MAIAFENKNAAVQEPEDYAFKKIVYIRGTKEGYNKIKPQADNYLLSTRNKNKMMQAAKLMKTRYLDTKKQIYSQQKIALTEQDIINMTEQYVNILGNDVTLREAGEQVGSTLRKMQSAIWSMSENEAMDMANNIQKYVVELENYFNSLDDKSKKDLIGIMSPKDMEGSIINIEKGNIAFSRMRNTLDRLSQLTGSHAYTFMVNMNRELGAVGEVITSWAAGKASSEVEKIFKNVKNLKMTDTGAQKSINESGSVTTAKADSLFTFTGEVNENEVNFQIGLSIKATGSVINPYTGKWEIKKKPPKIQIVSITEQEAIWNLLTRIYGSSTLAENSLLNTLVWASPNAASSKIIRKNLVAHYFDKFLAGSGGKLSGGLGYDQADCLIVNGYPIPMISIIGEALQDFENNNSNFVFVNLKVDNPWKGDNNKKDLTLAVARSKEVRSAVIKNIKMKISLNGNILYNLAKQYNTI